MDLAQIAVIHHLVDLMVVTQAVVELVVIGK
jgi:hypothetical protein